MFARLVQKLVRRQLRQWYTATLHEDGSMTIRVSPEFLNMIMENDNGLQRGKD